VAAARGFSSKVFKNVPLAVKISKCRLINNELSTGGLVNDEQLRSALQTEYLQIQKTLEDFDGRAITIKAWSVSFSLVAIGGAFASHSAPVLLVSCISAILFWVIEGNWKTFQYAHYARSGEIEEYFRGERQIDFAFQIGTSWSKTHLILKFGHRGTKTLTDKYGVSSKMSKILSRSCKTPWP
jgi:hypothetical protein